MGKPPRKLDLTVEHLARVAREVPDPGPSTRHSRLDEAEMAELARELLRQKGEAPFWVLAYGSLIWKPAFDHVEARPVLVPGWRRSFCLHITRWRGTPEQPGLMLAMARGGSCVGVAYRMPEDDPEGRMLRLLNREISYHVDIPWLRWLTVRGPEPFRALAFYCQPRQADPDFVLLPVEEQARRLSRAVGHGGSGAEYLRNTVEHLEALGIRDSYLWHLQKRVAAEIDGMG